MDGTAWGAVAVSKGVDISPSCSVRVGASCDCFSLRAREIVTTCRDFVSHKALILNNKQASGGNKSLGARSKKLIKKHSEQSLAPKHLQQTRDITFEAIGATNSVAITGLGWQPNPRSFEQSDVDETGVNWGGAYGKVCGHNEVAMFMARPFAPQEVVNTHLCSAQSPAPGNTGFDGCLEFLQAQCSWFRRSMTVWDQDCFHFIDSGGRHHTLRKELLLSLSNASHSICGTADSLQALMSSLRNFTTADYEKCVDTMPVTVYLEKLLMLRAIRRGDLILGPLQHDGINNHSLIQKIQASVIAYVGVVV
jgi:hypothetical protein